MRVSFILHCFSRGGSDRVAAHLARGFTDRGVTVDLTVFARGGETEGVLTGLAGEDIPIRYLGKASGHRALDLARGLPRLVRMLRDERPDIVVSTANNTALATAIAFRLARLPASRLYLKTTNPIASSRHRGIARWLRRWSYRRIFPWTAGVWTLSPPERDEMVIAFPDTPGLFRDVANPYVTEPMLAPFEPPPARAGKRIVSIARLTRQKRLDRLLRAFAEMRDTDATLLILGEGELRGELEALVADLGLGSRVSMPGYVADVAPALRAADLFVLTSDYEGLPAGILEAMAANCPVLATDCFPCARDLLETSPGCAIIADPSPAALAALIEAHLDRRRPTGLRAVAEQFSIANGVASHLEAIGLSPLPVEA